jgi:predicted phosphodiesterase
MARIAVITDIHGNLAGLLRTLEDIEARRCDRIICLGDLVDGGPHSAEVVHEIRHRRIPTVWGNHDKWSEVLVQRGVPMEWAKHEDQKNAAILRHELHVFLSGLPEYISEGQILYTHISPRSLKMKINDPFEAWNAFDECKTHRRIFVGHAHIPMIFGEGKKASYQAREHRPKCNEVSRLNPDDRYIICVGAVGYPRDGIRKIRYSIYDDQADTVENVAIDGPLLNLGH